LGVVVEDNILMTGSAKASGLAICPDPYTIFIICWGVSHYTVIHMLRWLPRGGAV
jgi:hypothetical protein